jgi:hypothetical protein
MLEVTEMELPEWIVQPARMSYSCIKLRAVFASEHEHTDDTYFENLAFDCFLHQAVQL